MENKSKTATDTEQLLRQAALFSEYDERETVLDMTANFLLNETPAYGPHKTRSIPKFYLNIFLAGLLVLGIGLFFLLRGSGNSTQPAKSTAAEHTQTTSGPGQEPGKPSGTETAGITAATGDRPAPSRPGTPVAEDSTQTDTETKNDFYVARGNGGGGRIAPPARVKRDTWPEIPEISEAEIAANEKRKADMVKAILKQEKRSWPGMNFEISPNTLLISATEVSNQEYRTFLYDLVINNRLDEFRAAAIVDSMWNRPYKDNESYRKHYSTHPAYNDYPVVNLRYGSMLAYCRWLSELVNKAAADRPRNNNSYEIRLPSESEWMLAALGNQTGPYPWGGPYVRNSKGLFLANFQAFRDSSGRVQLPYKDASITAPVISYFPNSVGLYCISGNVAEVVQPVPGNDSLLIKGGAWNMPAHFMQVKNRRFVSRDSAAQSFIGFRPIVEIKTK
ncbi:MAG: SUMF1/EgtB/PvdO family nonheme iron enzyme [Bacteroidia bacterium]|nr:SUMF1/EgtB/PvdO family nonheme iron enzyme [Bacteroidia bacterium]